jgi:hypothetical protein
MRGDGVADDSEEPQVEEVKKRQRPLPLTEALVLDIVEYLLKNHGYGFSTQISSRMVEDKPRRYTSREVVGILRNRPMFCHAQTRDRKGGKKWRLDMLALERYLKQRGFEERAESRGLFDLIRELKLKQIKKTIEVLENMNSENLGEVYEQLATLWS